MSYPSFLAEWTIYTNNITRFLVDSLHMIPDMGGLILFYLGESPTASTFQMLKEWDVRGIVLQKLSHDIKKSQKSIVRVRHELTLVSTRISEVGKEIHVLGDKIQKIDADCMAVLEGIHETGENIRQFDRDAEMALQEIHATGEKMHQFDRDAESALQVIQPVTAATVAAPLNVGVVVVDVLV
jgi:CheY-specific phosphatase CheX